MTLGELQHRVSELALLAILPRKSPIYRCARHADMESERLRLSGQKPWGKTPSEQQQVDASSAYPPTVSRHPPLHLPGGAVKVKRPGFETSCTKVIM